MQKSVVILFFLSLFCIRSNAQSDSIANEILNHKTSQVEIIMRGRSFVLEQYQKGDKQKTKQLFSYLVGLEDSSDVFPFYSGEKMLLDYWLGDYQDVLDIANGKDSSLSDKVRPPQDGFTRRLIEYARMRRDTIRNEIDKVLIIDLQTKAFLKLKYDDLLLGENYAFTLDSVNKEADLFLQTFPNSRYEHYVRWNIREVYKRSNWGLGFEFFSGYGIFTGKLSEYFTNPVPFGVAFDIQYKNFSLGLRDYLGLGTKTRKDVPFAAGTWKKGNSTVTFLPEAALGYVVLDNNRFKIVPFLGIAGMNISPNPDKDKPEYDDIGLTFTTTYSVGSNFDWKLHPAKKHAAKRSLGASDGGYVRIRYSYNFPQFEKKYNGFDGAFHNITIGFGGFARPYRRSL